MSIHVFSAVSIAYQVIDDYDLGLKNQKGAVPARCVKRGLLQRDAAS
jgi:hypothetical protein